MSNAFGCYSYDTHIIKCDLKKTRTPVKTPGFQWSYTGAKADLTAPGILAHEAGHHIDYCLMLNENSTDVSVKRKADENALTKSSQLAEALLIEIFICENHVSSYEPTVSEMLAEMLRVFILNPDLLRVGRPMRYKYVVDFLKLKPIISAPWERILENAHEKLIKAQQSWIKNWVRSFDKKDPIDAAIAVAFKNTPSLIERTYNKGK